MKSIYMLILMLVGMAISGEWQKPVGNLNAIKVAIKSKTLTVEKIQAVDQHGYTPLMIACFKNDNQTIKALLASNLYTANDLAQVNDFGESALMLVNTNEGIKMLIGTGKYDVQMLNNQDQDGNTALMYAGNNKNEVAAKMILNAGKFIPDDLEKKNANGQTFLSYCHQNGLEALASEAKSMAHKNTLATLAVVQSAMPMLVRGK